MIPVEFAVGLGAGLLVAVLLYLALWWWARRTASADLPPAGALGASLVPEEAPGEPRTTSSTPEGRDIGDLSAAPMLPGPSPDAGSLDPPNGSPSGGRTGLAGRPAPVRTGAPLETIRLSQRVILHVYAQGNLPPGAVAPPGLCQAGIGEALGISQGGLAAVLRRLEAAEILLTERGHVQGRDRRLKIYRLSGRGLEVAKELRARAHPRPTARETRTIRTD